LSTREHVTIVKDECWDSSNAERTSTFFIGSYLFSPRHGVPESFWMDELHLPSDLDQCVEIRDEGPIDEIGLV
jgi:hypothetical protein